MPRWILVLLVLVPATAAAQSSRCEKMRWGSEAELGAHLTEQARAGWALLTFASPGSPCFVPSTAPAAYECRRVKWHGDEELNAQLAGIAGQGWSIVAFAKPSVVCLRRADRPAAAAVPAPAVEAPAPTGRAPGGSGEGAVAPPAPGARVSAEAPAAKGDVRDRAAGLHAEREALEAAYRAGQLTAEEYARKKKELESAEAD